MNTTHEGAPAVRVPRPVEHSVKFRHADEPKHCASEQCPHGGTIAEGTKYARVARIGRLRKPVIELYHPACYDYEFDQGAS